MFFILSKLFTTSKGLFVRCHDSRRKEICKNLHRIFLPFNVYVPKNENATDKDSKFLPFDFNLIFNPFKTVLSIKTAIPKILKLIECSSKNLN